MRQSHLARLLCCVVLWTAALAASCRGAAVPVSIPLPSQPSPFGPFAATTPALSLAGAAHFVCVERRAPHIFPVDLPVHFRGERTSAMKSGEMEEAVIRSASCTRYTVALTLPLPIDDRSGLPEGLWESAVLLESLRVKKHRGPLWSLAAYLRLSAKEPFVYGRQTWISDTENVQLRFDPTQDDPQVMLRYELGL